MKMNNNTMRSLSTNGATSTGHPAPVLRRSTSLGFVTNKSPEKQKKRNKTGLRYNPYSVGTRRCLSLRSNSQDTSEIRHDSNCPKPESRQRITNKCDIGKYSSYCAKDTFYEKLIKENKLQKELSMIDMASRLKDSLTIDSHKDATPTTSRVVHNQLEDKDESVDTKNESVGEGNDDILCSEFFLPSFGDEFSPPSLICSDSNQSMGKDISSKEEMIESSHDSTLLNTNHNFLDTENISQILRKADTVLLFDDKENESDDDFDFSMPIFSTQPSCEGHKAQLSLSELLHENSKGFHNKELESEDESTGSDYDQHVDLDEILSSDWLNRNPFLMMSQKLSNYNDLSEMQGTYTCSVCSTNLEMGPFQLMKEGNYFSFPSVNWSRLRDNDVTLFCPYCCSERVVFHADRLLI